MLTLRFVVDSLSPRPLDSEQAISRVVVDSREAASGALFVALWGEQADGHDYVTEAFARGAVAALVQAEVPGDGYTLDLRQPPTDDQLAGLQLPVMLRVEDTLRALQSIATAWRARFDGLRVVGITGSVGKTTTKELVAEVLDERYVTLKNEGNLNNEIGLPLTVLDLNERHERLVLEMGMYDVGEIKELCDIAQPHVGVLTNVGPVHLERAGSMERIVAAKQELVEALPPAPEGVAVLNMDDERVMSMAAHAQARVFTYGLNPQADLWADDVESLGLEGVRFWLHQARRSSYVRVPLLGRHSVHTALRAAAVGVVEGLGWDEVVRGLQTSSAQLRLVAVPGPGDSVLLDDTYNSSPESAIAALNLLRELEGRRVAVLGDMRELGNYEKQGHRMVALRAREVADLLVTVGELGRSIAEEAVRGGMPQGRVRIAADSDEAIELLTGEVQAGDVVLVKGSRALGMERIVTALSKAESA